MSQNDKESLPQMDLDEWISWKNSNETKIYLEHLSSKLDQIISAWVSGALKDPNGIYQAQAVEIHSLIQLAFDKDELVKINSDEESSNE